MRESTHSMALLYGRAASISEDILKYIEHRRSVIDALDGILSERDVFEEVMIAYQNGGLSPRTIEDILERRASVKAPGGSASVAQKIIAAAFERSRLDPTKVEDLELIDAVLISRCGRAQSSTSRSLG